MKTYSISEVAEKYQLQASTLRYYEQLGLIFNVPRSHGRRIYNDNHLSRLSTICCFKNAGMNLTEIMELFELDSDSKNTELICNILAEREQKIAQTIAELQENQRHLNRKIAYYQAIKRAEETGKPRPEWKEYKQL